MNALVSKVGTPTGARYVQRIHSYLRYGFENIQPHCHGNTNYSIDLRETLLAVKTNFPFGFDLHHNKFVSSITWDFRKLDVDKPISSLAVWLAFGMFIHSKTILLNVGRKKIKLGNVWSFRKATSLPVFHSLHTLPNLVPSLLELSEESIEAILDDAQSIIDACCTVTYSDTASVVNDIPHYFNFCTDVTHSCLNFYTGVCFHEPVLSLRQRMLIEAYVNKLNTVGRLPKSNEVSFFQRLIDCLRPIGNLQIVVILKNLISDITVVFEVCQQFDLLQEFCAIFEFCSQHQVSA
ncbi:hypothetical protein HYG89_05110 [Acinetobacter sp. SwsAc5]|uniref:hypothetical protein n=1 Tax=Acinetobacter sp. SwsAc5 TaxID=2749438 RepID=UPI0015B9085D|nr:hypothetical protein [Acinetobacter sp. SwsAc5]NWK51946.1 hypothetical protein [Acinetobacter sp. SwsAc5]